MPLPDKRRERTSLGWSPRISGCRNPKLGTRELQYPGAKECQMLTDLGQLLSWAGYCFQSEMRPNRKTRYWQTNYNITVIKYHKTKQDLDEISSTPNFL